MSSQKTLKRSRSKSTSTQVKEDNKEEQLPCANCAVYGMIRQYYNTDQQYWYPGDGKGKCADCQSPNPRYTTLRPEQVDRSRSPSPLREQSQPSKRRRCRQKVTDQDNGNSQVRHIHPSSWTPTNHYGSCGQSCPCCRFQIEGPGGLGVCLACS